MVEKGADLVICQHSHCVGCEEKYNNGTIVYGQGNFLFDDSNSEFWQTGMLVSVNGEGDISYIPLKKCGNAVRMATEAEGEQITDDFKRRSEEIKQEGFVEQKYKEFAGQMTQQYLFAFSGIKKTFIYKVFDKLSGYRISSWIVKKKYSRTKKLEIENYIECEAHRELLLQGLRSGHNK